MVQYIIVPCLEQEICQKMSESKIRKITDFDNFFLSKYCVQKFDLFSTKTWIQKQKKINLELLRLMLFETHRDLINGAFA